MRIQKRLAAFDDVSRRDFVAGAAKAFLGLTAMPWLAPAARALQDDGVPTKPATARNVIYLFMNGGMSHLDTFDPKPGEETQGPIEAIQTKADGVRISQYFPSLAQQMDKIALVSSMFSNQGAHAQGQYFMHTSYLLRGTIRHPSLGAWVSRMRGRINPTLPAHVAIGNGVDDASCGFLESEHAPLPIGDPEAGLQNSTRAEGVSPEAFDRRLARLQQMNGEFAQRYDQKAVRAYDKMYEQAVRLMSSEDLAAFDITREPDSLREAYGSDPFGQGCLLARRLVEHGVRYVEVGNGGWDTHNENFDAMADKCPPLDRTLATLLADLDSRGLLHETLVVLATEFGRTPDIVAGRNGRNHYPKAFTCWMAGGGIRGGQRYGATDAQGREIADRMVTVPDFNATIAHALGLPTDHVMTSPSGRPFRVADKGEPVTALFG
ncbi:MAG: DUF1501 domain-containing protein [Planctomycetota bacterium]